MEKEKVRCSSCKREISKDECLTIRGVADVEGYATAEDFFDDGIIWEHCSSYDEKAQCPFCRDFFKLDEFRS